ncbi:MAG: hypothetical protein HYW07_03950 [Candidatus Latescibacteria bacterium]|nr:hypothetical protein [Candidatus Latescibacterota bacterium]
MDESGQDAASEVFVVVAVLSAQDQDLFREQCLAIEHEAGTGNRKWHKSRPERRLRYLGLALERGIGKGIDGIDQKKAAELTNALRLRGVKLGRIRSRKDEAEPLIRLADMWAGW